MKVVWGHLSRLALESSIRVVGTLQRSMMVYGRALRVFKISEDKYNALLRTVRTYNMGPLWRTEDMQNGSDDYIKPSRKSIRAVRGFIGHRNVLWRNTKWLETYKEPLRTSKAALRTWKKTLRTYESSLRTNQWAIITSIRVMGTCARILRIHGRALKAWSWKGSWKLSTPFHAPYKYLLPMHLSSKLL